MNYKKWICGVGTLAVCCMLTGCHINHDWQEATCTTPKTCSVGGETEGEPLGHTWIDATCSEPKHCSVCGDTEGEPLDHTWVDATCAEPKHCSVCGETEGEPLEHTLTEANYQQPATCEVCGETVGEPLQAYYEENGIICDAELDKTYSSTTLCYNNPNFTTTAKVTFSDYRTFTSDEEHESLEGYEWQTITVTFVYDDDNAWEYGISTYLVVDDYYFGDIVGVFENYTINYSGKDFEECLCEVEKGDSGWSEHVYTDKYILAIRVPEGYDGFVIGTATDATTDDFINDINFRLK